MAGYDYQVAIDSIKGLNLDLYPNLLNDGDQEIPADILNKKDNCDNEPKVAMSVFMILIVIIGLFGNFIVFFVILVLKEYKKSVSNWYVLQLALADTLFLLMLPFTASEEMVGKWKFPTALCKAKEGILMVNYYASIFFLTIMSFDRYMAVTRSGVSRWADVLRRLDSAALISLIAWLISIALAVPIYLYSHVNECDECAYRFPKSNMEICQQAGVNETECANWIAEENSEASEDGLDISREDVVTLINLLQNFTGSPVASTLLASENSTCINPSSPRSYRIWLYVNFSLLLVLPFVLICIFYGLILRAMMGTATTASTNQRQYRRRVTLMVLALVTLFAISWLPWYGVKMGMITGFSLSASGCMHLTNFVRIMTYLNSALNPYFYSLLSTRFPRRLSSALGRSKRVSSTFANRFGSRKRTTLHGVSIPPAVPQSSNDRHT